MLLGLLCLSVLTTAPRAEQVDVRGARIWNAPDQTRIVIDTAAAVHHSIFSLDDPDRLVIDVVDARLRGALPTPDDADLVVARIRSGVREGDDLRIVLDLKQPVKAKSFALRPNDQYGHRIVIDLEPRGGVLASTERLPRPPSGDPHPSVRAKRAPARELLIAVDAGHGGEDPGAIGASGAREKDITLAVARKLAARIDRQRGMRALLIRDGDYYVGLRQRIAKARKQRADLFVSIHADAFNDRRVRGSSVYTLSNGGATSEAAKWLAERENSADRIGGIDLKEGNEVLASVLLDMSQNATMEHSGIAASKVLTKLRGLGEVHQTKIQKAGFAVLKSPDIPSMLVETAFISNPAEEKRLRSDAYQSKLANAILDGIMDYFREYPPPGTRFASTEAAGPGGRKHRIVRGDTLSQIADNYNVSLRSLRSANNLSDDRIRVGEVLTIPGS